MSVTATMSFSPSTVSPAGVTTVSILLENDAVTAVDVVELRPTQDGQGRVRGILNGVLVPIPAEGSVVLSYDYQAFEETHGHTASVLLSDGSRASDSQTITVT